MSIIDVYGYDTELAVKPMWYCHIEGRAAGEPIHHDIATLAFTMLNINKLLIDTDPIVRSDGTIKWVICQADLTDFAVYIRQSAMLPQLRELGKLRVEDQSRLRLVQRIGYTFLEASKPLISVTTMIEGVVGNEDGLVVPALCLRKVLP